MRMKITSPEEWPERAQFICCGLLFLMVFLSGNAFFLESQRDSLAASIEQEQELKASLQHQYQQANSLPLLQKQQQQFQQTISTLEQSYLSTDTMATLMREVSTASATHHLQLELFKPNKHTLKTAQSKSDTEADTGSQLYYQEQAVQLKLHGRYHDIGLFLTALGSIPPLMRVVKLHLHTPSKDVQKERVKNENFLSLDAELLTYHPRDKSEDKQTPGHSAKKSP